MKRLHILAMSACVFPLAAFSQTVIYGLDTPKEIVEQVDEEEARLAKDTALYIERKKRFSKYEDAIYQANKDREVQKHTERAFPAFPPETVRAERERQYEYEKARKELLWNISSEIGTIDVDPLAPQVYTIQANAGEPTQLIFIDQSGAKWPVVSTDQGKANRFKAEVDKSITDSNLVSIKLEDDFVQGNLLVKLAEYNVPLVFRIVGNPTVTTPYASVRVHRYGPKAILNFSSLGPMTVSSCQDVYGLLESRSVPKAEKHRLAGMGGEVFVTESHTYVRSQYRLTFPPNTCATTDGNGNFAARIEGTGYHTATFYMENGNYETVRIVQEESLGAHLGRF